MAYLDNQQLWKTVLMTTVVGLLVFLLVRHFSGSTSHRYERFADDGLEPAPYEGFDEEGYDDDEGLETFLEDGEEDYLEEFEDEEEPFDEEEDFAGEYDDDE
jgi:hypothetical protein